MNERWLVGAHDGGTVPESAAIHVLRGAHRQRLLHCEDTLELRCVYRSVIRFYKEEREVKYPSMNAVTRTNGPVVLIKPVRGIGKGEFDLSSNEQARIFNAAWLG